MIQWHYLSGLASLLVVGLGQIIQGESKKGLQLILIFYLAIPAAGYASLIINGYLFLLVIGAGSLLGMALWIYSVWEALTYKE